MKKGKMQSSGIVDHTFKILKANVKTFVAAAVAFGILYSFLYGLWLIPGLGFGFTRTSAVTPFDGLYLAIIIIMSGSLAVLFKHKIKTGNSRFGGVGGVVAGFAAAACPACQGITLVALGSTVAFLPLGALSSLIWVFQLIAIFILWISLYVTANSIYTKTCITCKVPGKPSSSKSSKGVDLLDNKIFLAGITAVVVLVVMNQLLISATGFSVGQSFSGEIKLSEGFQYGPKTTLKPMPVPTGEHPRIAGYGSVVKPLPTISDLEMKPPTGDVVQDLVNNVIPTGTPWYGPETGVSFDDPIGAQNLWAKGRAIQLDSVDQERWNRIANSFTCDYCCGSPQNPTIITRCGCAHAQAAQGMAKWFIKNYGEQYSDEEIYGEMARWYALWYPGPTIQRITLEMSV